MHTSQPGSWVASFVPGVMAQAAQGSLLIALGGACAMLPDWLDFRFMRYLAHRDANIAPAAAQPDPEPVAEAIAAQMCLAAQEGRPRVVQLYPARQSAAEWVCYDVSFDVVRGDVVVIMDEVESRVHVGVIAYPYASPLRADELGGPMLAFQPLPESMTSGESARIQVDFLPWHRQWTHSLLVGVGLGIVLGFLIEPLAGIVAALGYAAHVLVDACGYMGVNLFAPLTRRRSQGLKLYHSADWIPNLLTVWVSLALLLLNMDRVRDLPLISVGPYLAFAVVLPALSLGGWYAWRAWKRHSSRAGAEDELEGFPPA